MNKIKLLSILLFVGCSNQNQELMKAPIAKKIPVTYSAHDDIRIDYYDWLRDDTRKNEEVLEHLRLENKYVDSWVKNQKHNYEEEIMQEFLSRLPENEISFPVDNFGVKYFTKLFKDKQLSTYYKNDGGIESLIFDPNIKFSTQDYYQVSRFNPSPSNKLAVFAEDNDGRRKYIAKFIELNSNQLINDELKLTSGNMVWAADSKSIYYLKKDPNTLISNKLYKHTLGESQSSDELIYEELDNEFNLGISKSSSNKFLILNIEKTNSNEIRILSLDGSGKDKLTTFLQRQEDHLYKIDHSNNIFYIQTNLNSPNYRIMQTMNESIGHIDESVELIPHDSNVYIQDFVITSSYIILEVRKNGLPAISQYQKESFSVTEITLPDTSYFVSLASSDYVDYENNEFHYYYSSPNRPLSIYKVNAIDNTSSKVWQKIVNNFNEDDYVVERTFNEVRDGTMVPATIVYKADKSLNRPILFYGYGSYGINREASFSESILPLINKGFIFVYLNIRGGAEMGKEWYEQGRMLNKMNSFYDFNDSVEAILNKGYGDKNNVFAQGGSAGGLLMGAIVNLKPELYKGIISRVPFVDVLTTMSDESIPLTTFEYDEWGNPNNYEEYMYMKKYSPYDNIDYLNYPSMLITSSLFDSQVQYFEPAKYAPKLREHSTSSNPILFKINLIGGHGGKSGRINSFEETAMEHNFLLNLID
jgi:oligopeptidase B